jgi:hypothetical protein
MKRFVIVICVWVKYTHTYIYRVITDGMGMIDSGEVFQTVFEAHAMACIPKYLFYGVGFPFRQIVFNLHSHHL